jgi:hypothetical protein
MLQASIISRRIHSARARSSATIRRTEFGNNVDSASRRGRNMTNHMFGAAVLAAVVSIAIPAHAAKMGGCSSPNLEKTEAMIENMADGDGKMTAQKEVALAQDALLNGKMGACGMHLNKAVHAGMGK